MKASFWFLLSLIFLLINSFESFSQDSKKQIKSVKEIKLLFSNDSSDTIYTPVNYKEYDSLSRLILEIEHCINKSFCLSEAAGFERKTHYNFDFLSGKLHSKIEYFNEDTTKYCMVNYYYSMNKKGETIGVFEQEIIAFENPIEVSLTHKGYTLNKKGQILKLKYEFIEHDYRWHGIINYEYDRRGNLTKQQIMKDKNPPTRTSTLKYNKRNKLIEYYCKGHKCDNNYEIYKYNEKGLLIEKQFQNAYFGSTGSHETKTYFYNENEKLIKTVSIDSINKSQRTKYFFYNSNGDKTEVRSTYLKSGEINEITRYEYEYFP
jgi:hypothetical protein